MRSEMIEKDHLLVKRMAHTQSHTIYTSKFTTQMNRIDFYEFCIDSYNDNSDEYSYKKNIKTKFSSYWTMHATHKLLFCLFSRQRFFSFKNSIFPPVHSATPNKILRNIDNFTTTSNAWYRRHVKKISV